MFKVGDRVLFTSKNACERSNGTYSDHKDHNGMIGTIKNANNNYSIYFEDTDRRSSFIHACELTLESEAPYKESVEDKLKRFNYIKMLRDINSTVKKGHILRLHKIQRSVNYVKTESNRDFRRNTEKDKFIFVTDKYFEKNKDRYVR